LRRYAGTGTAVGVRRADRPVIRPPPAAAARRQGCIDKRIHAHGLRHAYAAGPEREGATISMIRDLLGHSSAAVTDRYLRRLGTGEAVEFARNRNWTPALELTSRIGRHHDRNVLRSWVGRAHHVAL